jgi:tripartite-type tricarboxylate transporter receptor subunit TctC
MVINPLIFKSQNFDPKTSLTHVTRLFYLQHVFAVNASLNVKTFDQLAALAKSKPKTMNYLTPSLSKVAFMEAFNKKYGIDFVRVPFKGGGDAINSMMAGTTPVAIFGVGNLIQLIRAESRRLGCRRRHALTACSGDPDFQGTRLHRSRLGLILRHACAGRHTEADRRQAEPGDR